MNTQKEKALAHVRSVCPELLRLTVGCLVEVRLLPNPEKTLHKLVADFDGDFKKNGLPRANTHFEVYEFGGLGGDCMTKIIGHTPHLEHWLNAMNLPPNTKIENYTENRFGVWNGEVRIYFNRTTGQPATEEDYQKYNQIVGI